MSYSFSLTLSLTYNPNPNANRSHNPTTGAMITNSWSRRQLTMITAAFQLAGVIIDVIQLHSAMITTIKLSGTNANANSIADSSQIGTNADPR